MCQAIAEGKCRSNLARRGFRLVMTSWQLVGDFGDHRGGSGFAPASRPALEQSAGRIAWTTRASWLPLTRGVVASMHGHYPAELPYDVYYADSL
jgi:hypothetical protein